VILDSIVFLNYQFKITTSPRGETYLQATYIDEDVYTGKAARIQPQRQSQRQPLCVRLRVMVTRR
jgi:hypothetical protein